MARPAAPARAAVRCRSSRGPSVRRRRSRGARRPCGCGQSRCFPWWCCSASRVTQPRSSSRPTGSPRGGPKFSLEDRQRACSEWDASQGVQLSEAADPNAAFLAPTPTYWARSAAEVRALAAKYAFLPDLAAAATAVADGRDAAARGADLQTALNEPNRAYRWVCGKNAVAQVGFDPSVRFERVRPAWLPPAAPGTDYSGR